MSSLAPKEPPTMFIAHNTLSIQSLVWALLALLALTFASWLYYNAFLHPLTKVPGPRHWAATSYFYTRCVNGGQYAQTSLGLHAQYGPVVRVGRTEISITADEAWSVVYAYNAGTTFPKQTDWFRARPNGSYGILASPNSVHSRFRRVFAQAFTETSLKHHENLIDKHVDYLTEKLHGMSAKDPVINIKNELEYVSFDIAGDFAYSRSFECLQKTINRNQIRVLQQGMKFFTVRAMRRKLGIDAIAVVVGNAMTSMQPKRTPFQLALTTWTRTRLETASQNETPDLVDFVSKSTRTSKTLHPDEAENAIGDFMIAGTDTVSTTVTAALHYLTANPKLLEQLRSELTKAKLTTPLDHAQLGQVELLNAIVNETMRLAPSVPHTLPRTVPAPGVRIAGYFLPEGTGVSFNQYAAYRSPSNFSEPEKFDPMRWTKPDSFSAHNTAVFKPFSVGPRNCVGQQWGLRVVRALLARLVLGFDIQRVRTDWVWEHQATLFGWQTRDLELQMKPLSGDATEMPNRNSIV